MARKQVIVKNSEKIKKLVDHRISTQDFQIMKLDLNCDAIEIVRDRQKRTFLNYNNKRVTYLSIVFLDLTVANS